MYVAFVVDLCSTSYRRLGMSENNDRFLVIEALRRTVHARRTGRGLIHHSDVAVLTPATSTLAAPRRAAWCQA